MPKVNTRQRNTQFSAKETTKEKQDLVKQQI